jgi:phosphatidylserine/phosphatidylglycerophosphate/cardiolipin synthase-like enzyme
MYEQFIDWDIAQAKPLQVHPSAISLPPLIAPAWLFAHVMEADKKPPRYFVPATLQFSHGHALNVMPLLTPDNYSEHILRVIQGAKAKIYFQNQYINIGKQRDEQFDALLEAMVLKKSAGLDVRIILRDLPNSRKMLEDMQNYGFDMSCVKLQPNSHTKGIVVDSKILVLGSHNWSNEGTLYNRDASVMFFDSQIARYYEEIFLYDWDALARTRTAFETAMPWVDHTPGENALETQTARLHHREVVVPWAVYYED